MLDITDRSNFVVSKVGLSLKAQHFETIFKSKPSVDFFEIHAENYLQPGGAMMDSLARVRADYQLSVHGVGLSIGGVSRPDRGHLHLIKNLIDQMDPFHFSEHLAWSSHNGQFLNCLLPIPYDQRTLNRSVDHIDEIQSFLGRSILLENPASYINYSSSTFTETEFLRELCKRTGCYTLLDLTNVHVSCHNCERSPTDYLDSYPWETTRQIHLAGHRAEETSSGETILIDSHDREIAEEVFDLYAWTLQRFDNIPVLIERDANLPSFADLLAQVKNVSELQQWFSNTNARGIQ